MSKARLTAAETAIVEQINNRDCDGGMLLEQYKARLLWFARIMGVPGQDCADVVQDVFVAAIGEIRSGRFRGDSSLITWMDAILKNKIKDLWRSLARYRGVFAPLESHSGDDEAKQEFATWAPGQWDEHIDVLGMLDRMPDDLRLVLLMNENEGLTVDEISHRLKKPMGTVGRKLAEAKKLCRDWRHAPAVAGHLRPTP
jgi:RNA polymerase sigma factor (sigma-70 family)